MAAPSKGTRPLAFWLRKPVEGINGYSKDDNHEAIERSGGRRIRGIAVQTFLLIFQLAHVNHQPDPTGPPKTPKRPQSLLL